MLLIEVTILSSSSTIVAAQKNDSFKKWLLLAFLKRKHPQLWDQVNEQIWKL